MHREFVRKTNNEQYKQFCIFIYLFMFSNTTSCMRDLMVQELVRQAEDREVLGSSPTQD